MKILFDHQMFSLQRYGGVSRYFAGLSKGINGSKGNKSSITALYSDNEYLKDEPLVFNNKIGRRIFSGKRNLIYKWNKKFSKRYMAFGEYDILHPTYFDPYFLKYNKKSLVITVHDMIYESHPELFPDSYQVIEDKRKTIAKADAIIAISEHTKQDLIRFYPEVKDRICVVYHGYALNTIVAGDNLLLPKKYILFVGERWHYKNFVPFVKAVQTILNEESELHLICAGGGDFSSYEKALFSELNIANQCIQISATDAGLKQLYYQAIVFVFPSTHEGFGLPLLEAFANNCPVACSNSTALPEVAGNAAVYFDPLSQSSMHHAISQVLNDAVLQQDLKNKGRQRLTLFTIENCVQNTINVYRSVI